MERSQLLNQGAFRLAVFAFPSQIRLPTDAFRAHFIVFIWRGKSAALRRGALPAVRLAIKPSQYVSWCPRKDSNLYAVAGT